MPVERTPATAPLNATGRGVDDCAIRIEPSLTSVACAAQTCARSTLVSRIINYRQPSAAWANSTVRRSTSPKNSAKDIPSRSRRMASEESDGIVFPSSTLHTNAVENGSASYCWVRPRLRRASRSTWPITTAGNAPDALRDRILVIVDFRAWVIYSLAVRVGHRAAMADLKESPHAASPNSRVRCVHRCCADPRYARHRVGSGRHRAGWVAIDF